MSLQLLALLAVLHAGPPLPSDRALPSAPVFVDNGRVVEFPGGVVELNAPIEFADRDDLSIRGNDTTLVYKGPPTKAVLQFARMTRADVSRLKIRIVVPGVTAFVLVTNQIGVSPHGRVSTGCRFSDIWLDDGGHKHPPRYGFDVDSFALGGSDGNNDLHMFERCRVQHYTRAAWHLNGTQVHQITLDRCSAVNVHRSPNAAGVWCEDGGYFASRDCAFWGNNLDFEMGSRPNRVTVSNFNSEHAKRLIDLGTTGAKAQVSFRDVRWDGEPKAGGLPTMRLFGLGPIVLESVSLGGINGVAPTIVADSFSERIADKWVKQPGTLVARAVVVQQWHGGSWASPPKTFRVPRAWRFTGEGLVFGRVETDGRQPDQELKPERY